jgi:thiamine biosynthesis protein ThiS
MTATDTIRVIVNGLEETVPADASIAWLVERFEDPDVDLIVEHNGRFVYPQRYAGTTVAPGDRLEFIHPNFGG